MPASPHLGLCATYLCLQDTNALVFRALLAALGLSAEQDYDMNRCGHAHTTDIYVAQDRFCHSQHTDVSLTRTT